VYDKTFWIFETNKTRMTLVSVCLEIYVQSDLSPHIMVFIGTSLTYQIIILINTTI